MYEGEERHTIARCDVPTLNLTLNHWHFPGSYTTKPEWWWMEGMRLVAFEERMEEFWRPTLQPHVRGLDGRSPDLVLWQNGLWDQRMMWEANEADKRTRGEDLNNTRERQMMWEEVRFVMGRLTKLIKMVKEEFGEDVPMVRILPEDIRDDQNASLWTTKC